jgi:hypothetical protein
MSYDLMIFEPEAAPKNHDSFLAWCTEQTKWNEGESQRDHGSQDFQLPGER